MHVAHASEQARKKPFAPALPKHACAHASALVTPDKTLVAESLFPAPILSATLRCGGLGWGGTEAGGGCGFWEMFVDVLCDEHFEWRYLSGDILDF